MKRICLFAGYNYNNLLSQYVVDYIKELSKYADIYYLADGTISSSELKKLSPYARGVFNENHHRYDFGSYALLAAKYVGWKKIFQYDELILANDSCICVNSFAPVFSKMDAINTDAWGLLATDEANIDCCYTFKDYINIKQKSSIFCIGSYFFAVRKSCFNDFKKFLTVPAKNMSRSMICDRYEFAFINFMQKNHKKISIYEDTVYRYSTSYMNEAFMLVHHGFPLLKVRIFTDNIGGANNPMQQLYGVNQLCEFSPLPYVQQIQKERKIDVSKLDWKNAKNTKNKITHYIFPQVIRYPIRLFRDTFRKIKREHLIKKTIKFFIPDIMFDFKEICKDNFCSLLDKHRRLCWKKRPLYEGYYPCHIKHYHQLQMEAVKTQLHNNPDQIIIFFNIMRNLISGGMLSIDRLVEHASQMADANTVVLQSGLPLENAVIINKFFDYAKYPIDFSYIIKYSHPKKLLLNIPECFCQYFVDGLTANMRQWLLSIQDLRINILNQSDELMPPQYYVEELRTLCDGKLTITAAHQRYCTAEKEKQYRAPIYLLTPFLPNFYKTSYSQKEKIIVFSPDEHPKRQTIKKLLHQQLPDYKFITIKKMHLNDYKKLISRALFTITFGEGYDGYFIEPYFSGSIGFAVRNDTFFPKKMSSLMGLYSSWEDMELNIVKDIRKLEKDSKLYTSTSSKGFKEIQRFTNDKQSRADLSNLLKRFYQ